MELESEAQLVVEVRTTHHYGSESHRTLLLFVSFDSYPAQHEHMNLSSSPV